MSINYFPTTEFELIHLIFIERHWEKLTHPSPTPCVEVVHEFYSNIAHFNLDEHGIISIVRGTLVEISSASLIDLYDLPKMKAQLYPY